MDSGTFIAWQSHMRFTSAEAARQLGKSADTISRYRRFGVPESEALIVGLACTAIAMKLPPWKQK
ncbi:conserved hypothetical protein [Mesorhizobium plurifarium]|uniref:Uncharacterized protein n=1 Tax=Mesorhizobium plurifarium TaxID=69974 RepID=A0A090EA10_MESPL|nr:conserved hypothetical protein [Mesorhizobium plurifarium]